MKALILLSLSLTMFNVFATDVKIEDIPKSVLDRHVMSCAEFNSERGEWLSKEVFELPKGEYSGTSAPNKLFVLGCEMYAYNSMAKAYILNAYGDVYDVAITELLNDGSLSATTFLMGAGYDPDSQTLGTFVKGRGMGDCGSTATYKYNANSDRFVLVEQRSKEECDGEDTDWPVVYPKK
jgi:hypothetical protein